MAFSATHLLANLIPVEVRLSFDLMELALSSASFFEPSFLNGSFLACRIAVRQM